MARALVAAGAERVPLEEFRALDEDGNELTFLRGRDFEAWALPRRPVYAFRREFRLAVRFGRQASGRLAQHPFVAPANTPRAFVCRLPAGPSPCWLRTNRWDCLGRPRRARNWGIRFIPTKQARFSLECAGRMALWCGPLRDRIAGRMDSRAETR